MSPPSARDRFFAVLRQAVEGGTLVKLTLGKYRGAEASLRNVFVRPVVLKSGPHLCFVWRHATRDITKNLPAAEALARLDELVGHDFLDAHLFTPGQTAQLETLPDGRTRLSLKTAQVAPPARAADHNRSRQHTLDGTAGWLRDLGVTNAQGAPRTGMSAKFRQIQRFAELLQHAVAEAEFDADQALRVADMGSGKGYLTFATAAALGATARVVGVERRQELVDTCNRIAQAHGFAQLSFVADDIRPAPITSHLDVLIALHACDTATDDALAAGVAAGARLLMVSPCCQKELRPQLQSPPVLAPVLRHGIFHERHAEFVTDALRALLLEARGYRTKVLEFVSSEHTARNLLLVAVRQNTPLPGAQRALTEFASFYGLREQRLAQHFGVALRG